MCEEKLKWASKKCRKTCDLCDPNKLVSTETSTVTRETTILSTENTIVTDPPLNMTTVDSGKFVKLDLHLSTPTLFIPFCSYRSIIYYP